MWLKFVLCVFVVFAIAVASAQSPRLSDWTSDLLPVFATRPLADLTLLGSHDATSYDLSHILSLGTLDSSALREVLRILSRWVVDQAKTQTLDLANGTLCTSCSPSI
jgi:hypothetical protein